MDPGLLDDRPPSVCSHWRPPSRVQHLVKTNTTREITGRNIIARLSLKLSCAGWNLSVRCVHIHLSRHIRPLTSRSKYPKRDFSKSDGQKPLSDRFPVLHALVTSNATQGDTQAGPSFDQTLRKVEKSLEAFVLESYNITDHYFAFLQSFFEVEDQATKAAESGQWNEGGCTKRTKPAEDESYPRQVYDTLFRATSGLAECHCFNHDPLATIEWRHWGRLELRGRFGTTDDEVLFHTVFSKKGSKNYDDEIRWQHLQLRVPRYVQPCVASCVQIIITNPGPRALAEWRCMSLTRRTRRPGTISWR